MNWIDVLILTLTLAPSIYFKGKQIMQAVTNLTAAVTALDNAASSFITTVNTHASQAAAGSVDEAAVQAAADKVNGIVAGLQSETAKFAALVK